MKKQIKELCSIANELDKKGHYKLADDIDSIATKLTKEALLPQDESYWKETHSYAWNLVEEGLMRYKQLMENVVRRAKYENLGPEAVEHAKKSMRFARKQLELWQERRTEMDTLLSKVQSAEPELSNEQETETQMGV